MSRSFNILREKMSPAAQKAAAEKTQQMLKHSCDDYVPFELTDYVDNPVALACINAEMTQEELAKRMNVTQAYISKLEAHGKVTVKVLKKIKAAIKRKK